MASYGRFEFESIKKRVVAHNMHQSGASCEEIAETLNVEKSYVYRIIKMPKPLLPIFKRNQGWRDRAACSGLDTEIFFPSLPGRGGIAQREKAQAICAGCDVSSQCREWALANFENYGVWGGQDFSKVRYQIDESNGRITVFGLDEENVSDAKIS